MRVLYPGSNGDGALFILWFDCLESTHGVEIKLVCWYFLRIHTPVGEKRFIHLVGQVA